tara:strand:- start:824 stop:1348 length:525 start_codon:yes stop_codon:yes gene_type:complete
MKQPHSVEHVLESKTTPSVGRNNAMSRRVETYAPTSTGMHHLSRHAILLVIAAVTLAAPAQALIAEGNDEGAALLGAMFLSMLTVPLTFLLFLFAISPKTRPILRIFAGLPGLMTVATLYLVLIAGQRPDMLWLPMFHAGLAGIMFWVGGLGRTEEVPMMMVQNNNSFPPQGGA